MQISFRNLFELNSKKNIILSVLSDNFINILKIISYYIVFVCALQLFLFFFGFGTNYEFYKFSLMLGILGLNTLLLSVFKPIKSKRVKVRNR